MISPPSSGRVSVPMVPVQETQSGSGVGAARPALPVHEAAEELARGLPVAEAADGAAGRGARVRHLAAAAGLAADGARVAAAAAQAPAVAAAVVVHLAARRAGRRPLGVHPDGGAAVREGEGVDEVCVVEAIGEEVLG